ncbi:hypothetical protein PROFUN_15257 [Planoprotostelium fungivorum]|uniref:Protein kinase domain-containing protein n=1 Tax=Planoprotostelium fungivorum TaxID=1890364 RepID=A0A2P6MXJ7_9EUKA|nr:hypothetical protein PROFUN_15257 [Planoprotostelium fungivorum]
MHKYKLISKKGEGTFSEVVKAVVIKTNKQVAIKRMKTHFETQEQVNSIREIQALRRLAPHPCIVKLLDVVFDKPTGRLALVFELMDMNIYELIRGRKTYLQESKVKSYMYQLLKAIDHMHRNGIFHRDIKPENLLLTQDTLKLADLGSCRGIKSKQPFTEYISTRWYRAPECLLTDGYYTHKMDMWGVGCVMFEVLSLYPLFPGTNELDQIQRIHNIIGTPPTEVLNKMRRRSTHMNFNFPPKVGTGIDKLLPNASADCLDLLKKLLAYNPDERLSSRTALKHPYFKDLREAEKRARNSNAGEEPSPRGPDDATVTLRRIDQSDSSKLPVELNGRKPVRVCRRSAFTHSTQEKEQLTLPQLTKPSENINLPPIDRGLYVFEFIGWSRGNSTFMLFCDILLVKSNRKVPITFKNIGYHLGYLDPGLAEEDLPAGSQVELPLWLSKELCRSSHSTMALPKACTAKFMGNLRTDPVSVPLGVLTPYFYTLPRQIFPFVPANECTSLLELQQNALRERYQEILIKSQNMRNVDLHEFRRKLTVHEKKIFDAGYASAVGYDEWRNGKSQQLTASNVIINKKRRLESDVFSPSGKRTHR